jgi:hypothetical protein
LALRSAIVGCLTGFTTVTKKVVGVRFFVPLRRDYITVC